MQKKLLSLLLALAIFVPSTAFGANYVIQRGDTLSALAQRFGVSLDFLVRENNIQNPDRIYAGDTLVVEQLDDEVLGAGYTPVTGYQSRTTTFVSAAASTIPVASTRDKAGNAIDIGSISTSSTARVYLSLATGTSREEILACTGVTASSWTGCLRGLSFQGGSMTPSSTLAFTHNAGTAIIITDVGQFFTEFVSISGDQTIEDVKTFQAFPVVSSTTALPTTNGQFATKYYVDQVGAGGFTASNVSTTRGLSVDGSAPERVGVNASTTRGLAFDTAGDGNLYINASSTGGIGFASGGEIQVDGTDNFVFSGNVTSTGSLRAPTPTLDADVATKLYTDTELRVFTATGTAYQAITAGQALFVTPTSSIGVINTSTGTSTYAFVGIANASASAGAVVSYTRVGGVTCTLSGLTAGAQYYLNGTAGQISTTAGTNIGRVGLATSATCLQVLPPEYIASGNISASGKTNGGTDTVSLGFYPGSLRFMTCDGSSTNACADGVAVSSISWSDNGGYLTYLIGGASRFASSGNEIFKIDQGAGSIWTGTVSKSATGFTLTYTWNSIAGSTMDTHNIRYVAESL